MTLKLEAIDPVEVAGHLDRLSKSDLLCRSAALTQLLEFLVARALHGDGEHLKESVIAMELFHRGADFDSKLDNIVRVHAHRLRRVLDAWYQGEGASDKLRFSIPRGGYTLHIEQRDEVMAEEPNPGLGTNIASLEVPRSIPSQLAPHDRKPSRFHVMTVLVVGPCIARGSAGPDAAGRAGSSPAGRVMEKYLPARCELHCLIYESRIS
jgi:hypothetical protein